MQRRVSFIAGAGGEWRVERIEPVLGETVPSALGLARIEGDEFTRAADARWILDGIRSHHRYTTEAEKAALVTRQAELGRPDSTCAALIPITKSAAWWQLAQDERRRIFEDRSRHIALGLDYLPAIARRLYHCHDLGGPFDFLTWFEFAERDRTAFDHLVAALRATEEWRYVTREVDIRLTRA